MYTFMIADDEKAIRESIPKVIDFERYGFKLCGTARDGREALEKTIELHPNLVLLDIRMPNLDGLGYLRELRDQDLEDVKVIILSGYSDFSYAQTALKYGAKGFLTKPMDEDELVELLTEIKEALDKDKLFNKKEYIQNMTRNLIKIYHDGNGNRSNYKDFCFLHFVNLNKNIKSQVYSLIYSNLCDIFNEEVELFMIKGSVYSFLCNKNSVTVHGQINETVISHVMNRLSGQGIDCVIIVDNELFDDTGNTFRSDFDNHLYSMLTDIYWNDSKNFIVYSKGCEERITDSWQSIKNHVMNLKNAICEENESEAFLYLEAIFQDAESQHIEFISLVEIYYRVFYTLRDLVTNDEEVNEIFQAVRWQESPYFVTHKEMQEQARSRLNAFLKYLKVKRRNQNLGVGEMAVEFIKNNFMKQILLKDVADVLYVNPAYLGRCIQKETGLTFNNFIANIRMEKAKDLLKNTDMMVYQIADAVGYTESKHFVSKFTLMVGCAPLSYRKKFQKV